MFKNVVFGEINFRRGQIPDAQKAFIFEGKIPNLLMSHQITSCWDTKRHVGTNHAMLGHLFLRESFFLKMNVR